MINFIHKRTSKKELQLNLFVSILFSVLSIRYFQLQDQTISVQLQSLDVDRMLQLLQQILFFSNSVQFKSLSFAYKYYIYCKKRCEFINTQTQTQMKDLKIPKTMNLTQNQIFGCQQPYQAIHHEDIINAIEFDPTGEFLAIGDNAGRIILFKQEQDQFGNSMSFEYCSQFQSHLPQFDTLRSLTMSECITKVNWLNQQGKYKKMLTANNNCIKLWKMFQKTESKLDLTTQRESNITESPDLAIPRLKKEKKFTSKPQIIFPIKHSGNINQVEVAKNQQYVFSTDQERAIIWNFEKYNSPFIVQDVSDKKDWKKGQKITCSKLHPLTDNVFICGTSKGRIELSDLRVSINDRKNASFLAEKLPQNPNNYFDKMTCKINSLDFLSQGKYIVSRDYLTVKVWDICRPSEPVNVINVNQKIQQKMCSLFENDCIQDMFQISSFSQNLIVTGSYDNRFNLIDPLNAKNVEYSMDFQGKHKKSYLNYEQNRFSSNFDYNRKVLKFGVHKDSQKIALASLNTFFIYSPQIQSCPNIQT